MGSKVNDAEITLKEAIASSIREYLLNTIEPSYTSSGNPNPPLINAFNTDEDENIDGIDDRDGIRRPKIHKFCDLLPVTEEPESPFL